jgi:hypothetical protein
MPKPKGGRGKKAPYDTKLARIPVPLTEQVNQLVERYQEYVAGDGQPLSPPILLDQKPVNNLNSLPKPLASPSDLLNKLLRRSPSQASQNKKSQATYLDVKILLSFLASSTEAPRLED